MCAQAYGYLKDDSLRLQLAQRFAAPRASSATGRAAAAGGGPGSFYNPRASGGQRASTAEHGSNTWQYYRQQERSDPYNGPFSRYNTNDDPAPPKHMG